MKEALDQLCKGCKHFVLENDVDGPGIPWCGNPETKKLNHPIGFLSHNAKACQFFDASRSDLLEPILSKEINDRRDIPTRKEHWSFTVVKLCFCVAFLKSLFTGHDEMSFKMAIILVALSAISLGKEVSANFINGSVKLSR